MIKQSKVMKKSNRNLLAYARQPNQQIDYPKPTDSSLSQESTANQTIYHAIIDQMEPEHFSYISKLVFRNQRQQKSNDDKVKTLNASLTHERTKSHTEITSTPKNKQNVGFSYRGHERENIHRHQFFSKQASPTGRNLTEIKTDSENEKLKQKEEKTFVNFIDSYLDNLKRSDDQKVSEKRVGLRVRESSSNVRLLDQLEQYEKRIKQLKLSNHILETENQKMKKNQRKLKKKMKGRMQEVVDYAKEVTLELQNEKYERRKIQDFFKEVQKRMNTLRPQNKARTGRIEEFLLSQSTEQDEIGLNICEIAQFRPKSIKSKQSQRHKVLPEETINLQGSDDDFSQGQ